jgi:hypothetical protein
MALQREMSISRRSLAGIFEKSLESAGIASSALVLNSARSLRWHECKEAT